MLLLTSTSDKVQVITSAAGTVDVHASWVDLASGVVTPGRTNTKITTATTTDVVGSPAASTVRNIKQLHVANNHASTSVDVTIQHTDGTNVIPIEKVTLLAAERIAFVEGVGWRVFDSQAREKIMTAALPSGGANTAGIAAFSADTYMSGANLPIAGRVQAGSFFRWYITASKGAAGVATPTFIIRTGTAGAIGDTARLTMTGPAQTAAADTARIRVEATLRVTGASAVIRGDVQISHNLAATGFAVTGPASEAHFGGTSAAFDITPSGTIIGLSVNPGASGAWVVDQVTLDAVNLIA